MVKIRVPHSQKSRRNLLRDRVPLVGLLFGKRIARRVARIFLAVLKYIDASPARSAS